MRYRKGPNRQRLETSGGSMDKILTGWVTVEQAAARVGTTPEHILELIRSGKIQAYYFATESETVN